MTDLKLNAAGDDIELENGRPVLVTDPVEATAQRLNIGLTIFQGEWFLNLRAGVPYHGRILVRGVNEADVYSIFRNFILKTDGVVGLQEDVNVDFSRVGRNRVARITAKAITDTGEVISIDTGSV